MKPGGVKERNIYVTGTDKQGEFSTAENNALNPSPYQLIDNVNAGTTRRVFYFLLAQFVVNYPMNHSSFLFSWHQHFDAGLLPQSFTIELLLHNKPRSQ